MECQRPNADAYHSFAARRRTQSDIIRLSSNLICHPVLTSDVVKDERMRGACTSTDWRGRGLRNLQRTL